MIRAVLDTNGLVAGLRSASGASYQIILAADRGGFEIALSVPLLIEYEDVTSRPESGIPLPPAVITDIINRLDPKHDMVLEVALAAGVSHIITFNKKDLKPTSEFGIAVVQPSEFLPLIL